jgi:hypothetical protein
MWPDDCKNRDENGDQSSANKQMAFCDRWSCFTDRRRGRVLWLRWRRDGSWRRLGRFGNEHLRPRRSAVRTFLVLDRIVDSAAIATDSLRSHGGEDDGAGDRMLPLGSGAGGPNGNSGPPAWPSRLRASCIFARASSICLSASLRFSSMPGSVFGIDMTSCMWRIASKKARSSGVRPTGPRETVAVGVVVLGIGGP